MSLFVVSGTVRVSVRGELSNDAAPAGDLLSVAASALPHHSQLPETRRKEETG
jgi:hypothetical protein